jgi:hypothetical protein
MRTAHAHGEQDILDDEKIEREQESPKLGGFSYTVLTMSGAVSSGVVFWLWAPTVTLHPARSMRNSATRHEVHNEGQKTTRKSTALLRGPPRLKLMIQTRAQPTGTLSVQQ